MGRTTAPTASMLDEHTGQDLIISAMRALPDLLVLIDSLGHVHYVSPSVTRVLGLPASRVIGRPIADRVAVADRRNLASWISHARYERSLPDLSARLRRKDGSLLLTEVRLGARVNGHRPLMGLSFRDISARARVYDSTVANDASVWWQVCDRLNSGIIGLAAGGVVTHANAAACRLLGITPTEVIGRDIDDLMVIAPGDESVGTRVIQHAEAFRRAKRDSTFVAELRGATDAVTVHVGVVPATSDTVVDGGTEVVLILTRRTDSRAVAAGTDQLSASLPLWDALSPRERQVLHRLAGGADVREISTALDISIHTARAYVKSILHKFGVRTQLQAVLLAARSGMLDLV